MGYTPAEVDRMSVWQFNACAIAHQTEDGELSAKDKDELWEWMQGQEAVPLSHKKH